MPKRRLRSAAALLVAASTGPTSFALSQTRLTMAGGPSSTVAPHRFYVLRHGETDANASGLIQGSTDDSRLTERGQAQAAKVGSSIFGRSGVEIESVFVSPLTRAAETLAILREHSEPSMIPSEGETVLHDLREVDLYDWEGRHKSEIEKNDPDAYAAWKVGDAHGVKVSGRKPIVETWARAAEVWKIIRSARSKAEGTDCNDTTSSTLLVCHGTLGQALLNSAFGLDESHFRRHEFPNCGLVEIIWHTEEETARNWRWHHPRPSELLQPLEQAELP